MHELRRGRAATILEVEADLDLQAQKDRHAQAEANRGVWVKPVQDGMARIGAEVSAIDAQRFALDLEELVRTQKVLDDRTGVARTQQQRRADVLKELPSRHLALLQAFRQGKTLTDLLPEALVPAPRTSAEDGDACVLPLDEVAAALFALPVRNPMTMYVHIPMTTVLDLDNRSGYVEGLGAITAHRARLLRPIASLQRLWVDARTGVPLGIDHEKVPPVGAPDWDLPEQVAATAAKVRQRLLHMLRPTAIDHRAEPHRQPSVATKRFVQVRNIACTGPGCPMRASRCELDHEDDWALGGLTAEWNLGLKSPRCHHCRHDGWQVRRSDDGTTVWISPLGSTVFRRSPWRPPPRGPKGDLPAPTLDNPDGGKSPSDWYADPALARSLDSRLLDQPRAASEAEPERPPSRTDVQPDDPGDDQDRVFSINYSWPDTSVLKQIRRPYVDPPPDKPLDAGWGPPPF